MSVPIFRIPAGCTWDGFGFGHYALNTVRGGSPREYRDHAENCRLQAEQCSTEIEKEHWGKMAEEWLRMARDADAWQE
jgi:hypothetical protein